jgi:hypothetical protein
LEFIFGYGLNGWGQDLLFSVDSVQFIAKPSFPHCLCHELNDHICVGLFLTLSFHLIIYPCSVP